MQSTVPSDFRRVLFSSLPSSLLPHNLQAPEFRILFPTVLTTELWATPTEADIREVVDRTPSEVLFPQPGETKVRVLEFRPEKTSDSKVAKEAVDQMLSSGGGALTRGDLHRTMSTDYFVVLSGHVTLSAEDRDVELSAGDTVVCLGALHGWSCRTASSARIFSVLVGAENHGDTTSGTFVSESLVETTKPHSIRRVVLGHDPSGLARILEDARAALPARLWSTEGSVPDNTVRGDRLQLVSQAAPDSFATSFEVNDLEPGEHLTLQAEAAQVVGVVLEGALTGLGTGESGARHSLATGDTFVSVGENLQWSNESHATARIGWVVLRGTDADVPSSH